MDARQLFTDATTRPIRLRMRPDLVAEQQCHQGQTCWVLKDPVSLRYYRFQSEEYFLLSLLDGETSLDALRDTFERRFPPQRISVAELNSLIGAFHQRGLVLADAPGQGRPLAARADERAQQEWVIRLMSFMSLRLPAFDPDAMLGWLDGVFGWIFTIPALCGFIAFMLAALVLVGVQFETFLAKLPTFHDFFGLHNWFFLAATLAATKVIHEFGHGLASKRFGGECHEMGVLLLCGVPCLYCNVTDSWMLPSKWQRMAIGAAGMYVELILAAAAVFLWWFSAPGMLHYLALNVIFVCGVSTLVFNANPLLRYDGYYILGDWLEIPNLRQKADQLLSSTAAYWLLGIETPRKMLPSERGGWLLTGYAVAAGVYRWIVTLGILWFLNSVLEPYGLKIIGQLLALAMAGTFVGMPAMQLWTLWNTPGRSDSVSTLRWTILAGTTAALLAAAFFIPLPYSIYCPVQVAPRAAATVYVSVGGQIRELRVRPGAQVAAGDVLAVLDSLDLELTITQLYGEQESLISRLDDLQRRALQDEAAALEIDSTQESLAAIVKQLQQRIADRERLTIRAPVAGTVLPAERTPKRDKDLGLLPTWSGTPLDERNVGASLDAGVVLCRIGDPAKLSAEIAIDQQAIEFVREQQSVDVILDELPGTRLSSRIASVSQSDLKVAPRGLSAKAGGQVATRTDAAGHERPINVTYQASVPLDDADGLMVLGVHGQARIHAGYQTLAARVWRYASETFHFRM